MEGGKQKAFFFIPSLGKRRHEWMNEKTMFLLMYFKLMLHPKYIPSLPEFAFQ